MIVVSDTSPLNYLLLINQVELLPKLFDRVVVPFAVMAELGHAKAPSIVSDWAASPPVWLEIVDASTGAALGSLGRGETEAIELAQRLKADILLIDERKAATIAGRLGLTVVGTLGVLWLAAEKNLIALDDAFELLRQTNYRAPAKLMDELLKRDAKRQSG